MTVELVRDFLYRNGWADPALAVLLFVVIVGGLYGLVGAVTKTYIPLLGVVLYAIVGAGFVYLSLWNLLIITVWFLGAIFLGWFALGNE